MDKRGIIFNRWLAVDYNGIEKMFYYKPKRCEKHGEWWGECMILPYGSIKKLIGRELTFNSSPEEIK